MVALVTLTLNRYSLLLQNQASEWLPRTYGTIPAVGILNTVKGMELFSLLRGEYEGAV